MISPKCSVGALTDPERRIITDGCLINYYRNNKQALKRKERTCSFPPTSQPGKRNEASFV